MFRIMKKQGGKSIKKNVSTLIYQYKIKKQDKKSWKICSKFEKIQNITKQRFDEFFSYQFVICRKTYKATNAKSK